MHDITMLVNLERAGWDSLCDGSSASFYGQLMTHDGAMILANGQVMDRDQVVAALTDAPPWRSYEMDEPRVVPVDDGSAALVYRASANRSPDQPPFVAVMTSVYVKSSGNWRLALYQQTPVTTPHGP